jgi:thiazole/oxazole-forming peptide maturase SagC family component
MGRCGGYTLNYGRSAPALDAESTLCVAVGLDVVTISADEVLIQFGTRSTPSELIRDTELTGLLGRLFARVEDAPTRIADLLEGMTETERNTATRLLGDLVGRGYLSTPDRSPFQQYIAYAFGGRTDIDKCRVALVGAGPVGARIASTLLRHGLGHLDILDDRIVDELWAADWGLNSPANDIVGKPAHQVLAQQLPTNGRTSVEAPDLTCDQDGIQQAVDACDFVILAFEQLNFRLAHLVNRCAIRRHRPWIMAMLDGDCARIGPLFLPPNTACFSDFEALSRAATPSSAMARVHRRFLLDRRAASFFPGLPVYADMAAAYASIAVLHYLIRGSSFAVGRTLSLDFASMKLEIEDVIKLPRCPVCGKVNVAARAAISGEIATRHDSAEPRP